MLTGSDLYVSTTGNDQSDCSSGSSPCQTIHHVISISQPGDSIWLDGKTHKPPFVLDNIHINKTLMFAAWNGRPNIVCQQQSAGCCDTYLNHTTPATIQPTVEPNITAINGSAFAYWFEGLSIENCRICATNTSVHFSNMTMKDSGFTMLPGHDDFYQFDYVEFKNSQISIVSTCSSYDQSPFTQLHLKNVNLNIKNSQLLGSLSSLHTSGNGGHTQTLGNINISLENIDISSLSTGIVFSDFKNLHLKIENMTMRNFTTQDYCLAVRVAAEANAHINISNSTLEHNICSFGGAFHLNTTHPEHIDVDIINTVFANNKAVQSGGAIRFGLDEDAPLQHVRITNCTFDSNVNYETAAGIYLEAGTLEVMNCTFLNNKVYTGRTMSGPNWNRKGSGGAIYAAQTGKISLTDCIFLSNSANWFGGTILSLGDLTIRDCYFENSDETGQAALGDVLYLTGSTQIDNMTIHIKKSYSNNPIFWYSSDIFNITGLNGGYINITCPPGARIHNETLTDGQGGNFRYNDLFYMCNPCPADTYSLQAGYVRGFLHSGELNMSSGSQNICNPCEYGGVCTDGQIQAKINFWGYDHGDVPKVSFIACPDGYCCDNKTCDPYYACNEPREGPLCGQCQQGYSEHLFTTECIPNEDCDDKWFLVLDFIMCCLYLSFFLFYIEVTVFLMQALFKIKVTTDGKVSTRAYMKIIFYFYQTVGQLAMHKNLVSKKIGLVLKPFISYLLTFQPIYGLFGACPFQDMTPVTKTIFNTMPTLGFFLLFSLLTIAVYVQQYRQTKRYKSEMISIATRITANPRPNMKSRLASAFVNFFLFNYINISNMTILLLACIPLDGTSVLYLDGNVTCVAPWQSIFILLAIIHVFPFFLVVIISRDLLEKGKISLTHFFLSYIFPLPMMTYWACVKLKQNFNTKKLRINSRQETADYHSFANDANHEADRIKTEILFIVEEPYIKHHDPENCVLYWEGILIFRRLIIVVFGTFIVDRLLSITLQMSMCLVFLIWHIHQQPFGSKRANQVETASLTILSFISLSHVIKAAFFTAGKLAEGPNKVQIVVMSWMEWAVVNVPPILVVSLLIGMVIYRLFESLIKCICRYSHDHHSEHES